MDPYLTDRIYLSLTTSAAAYQAAAIGSWLKITSTEYANLKTTPTGTTTVGATNTVMGQGGYTSIVNKTVFVANTYNGTQVISIPTRSYFYAVSFIYSKNGQTGNRVYINANSSSTTGFVQQGGTLPASDTGSDGTAVVQYYVLKGQSNATSASNAASFAFYDDVQATGTFPNVTGIRQSTLAGIDTKYQNMAGAIPTSSTDINLTVTGAVMGLQGIVASSVQWVTS